MAMREPYGEVERRVIRRLRTPEAVQAWLCSLPYNWERGGETLRTFRGVVRRRTAHCFEAALAAAAILEAHGHPPILLDLDSEDNLDHILFVFRRGGRFGAVGRSRDPGLHGRRPVYPHLTALARSYAAPFIDGTGRLRGYRVLDLRTLAREWRVSAGNVWFVERAIFAQPLRRLPSPEAWYRRWHRRFLAFRARQARGSPVYFPNRALWMPRPANT